MTQRPVTLRPQDVVVVLQLTLTPEATFAELGRRTGVSVGEAHNSVKRLEGTWLLTRKGQRPNSRTLVDFLLHGVPIAFPAHLGPEARGVPTARSGPDLREELVFDGEIVWPSAKGEVRGQSLVPLTPQAPELVERNPELYRLLALVDALRVGKARERERAATWLRKRLGDVKQ